MSRKNHTTRPRCLSRLVGLDPRVGIDRVQVVNRGFMGLFGPHIQWGWQVTLDGKRHGDPVLRLKHARKIAMKLPEPNAGAQVTAQPKDSQP